MSTRTINTIIITLCRYIEALEEKLRKDDILIDKLEKRLKAKKK